jgi:hypothetical protein
MVKDGQNFAQSDLTALHLTPCAIRHFCFIIRDASKAYHFVPQRTLIIATFIELFNYLRISPITGFFGSSSPHFLDNLLKY